MKARSKTENYELRAAKRANEPFLSTIYTGPEDTFASLADRTGTSREFLTGLNPHINSEGSGPRRSPRPGRHIALGCAARSSHLLRRVSAIAHTGRSGAQ